MLFWSLNQKAFQSGLEYWCVCYHICDQRLFEIILYMHEAVVTEEEFSRISTV